jgi:serine protease
MRRILPLSASLAAIAALAGAGPASAQVGLSQAHGFAPHQVVYKLRGERFGRSMALPVGVGVVATAAALRRNPRIAYAEPNYIATASAAAPGRDFLPDDPGTLEGNAAEAASAAGDWAFKQWNFLPWEAEPGSQLPTSPGGIDAVGGWRNLIADGKPGAEGTTVAVLDTGVDSRNDGPPFKRSPDFAPGFPTGIDLVHPGTFPADRNGHGTHVAGTIAEETNNGVGLAGLAYGAKILPVRVLDRNGLGRARTIAEGIRYAVRFRVQVINMSFNFGCGKKVPMVDEALREAYEKGIVTVASAGNLGSESCVSEPATGPRVIAVGATTEGGCIGNYSLAGPIDLVAPGGGEPVNGCPSILSRPIYQVTLRPGSTDSFSIPDDYVGTSMAAAHVSAVAAMILAIGYHRTGPHRLAPTHVVKAVTDKLLSTARSLGLPRTEQGAGLLDAARATAHRQLLR